MDIARWIETASAWLQSWLSAEAGLWGLFASAFLSATVLPGSSELVMTALVTAYPALVWPAFAAGLAGNALGSALTFGMGHAGRQGYERFKNVRVDLEHPQVQRLRRWGPPALVLSFLPLVGDVLVLAAGWLKMPPLQSLAWVVAGKALRYLVLLAGLWGVVSLG
jgi:membrane protein YqaA with SNARE-associated domain